jgi:hypothetical protein
MSIGFLQGRRSAALTFFRVAAIAECVALLAAVGCHRRSAAGGTMPIRTQITPQPVHVGEATLTVTGIVDSLGEPLAGVHIQVEGDMAHPGMAPVFGDAKETVPGTYQAQLQFNMPGDWVVLEHIRLADGSKIERQIDVRGVRAQ